MAATIRGLSGNRTVSGVTGLARVELPPSSVPIQAPTAPGRPLVFKKRTISEDPADSRPATGRDLQKLLQQPVCSTTRHHRFLSGSATVTTTPAAAASETTGDLLVAEPVILTEIRIGYARVSTGGQKLERQLDALTRAGCRRIFAEKKSGRNADRPELAAALEFMRPGDTLVVPALDRLSRSLQDLITTVADLRGRGVGFTSLHENLDTTTPGGRLVFHVFAALAEFIRELIVAGTHEGLAAARARGRVGGRPSVATPDIIAAARDMLPNPHHSITSIAKLLGISPGTLYNHIPDLRELRTSASQPKELPR
jgi:DNA invertase Pin-like site-specific DNA recombinase